MKETKTRKRRDSGILPVLFAAAVLGAPAHADDGACRNVASSRVVVLPGWKLGPLHGTLVEDLRLWTYRDDEAVPVPFQVDACDAEGRIVLDLPASASPKLDARHVLLFRTRDAGAPPAGSTPKEALEIRVHQPTGTAAVYFGAAADAVPISDRDYVDYDHETSTVRAERYTLGFTGPYADSFSVADGKGQDRGDLLDRLKARVEANVLWGLIRFERNEEQVSEHVLGYRDGPIRAILRVGMRVNVGLGLRSPEIVSDDYFYADHAEGPISISLPFSLDYVFGDLDVRVYLDFLDLSGFHVAAAGIEPSELRVGSGVEPDPPPRTHWFALIGKDVTLVHRLRTEDELRSVDSRLYYRDVPHQADPPEEERGLRPAIGYRLTDWSDVGRGRHRMWMDTYVVDPPEDGTRRSPLDLVGSPPRVTVRWPPTSGAPHRPAGQAAGVPTVEN